MTARKSLPFNYLEYNEKNIQNTDEIFPGRWIGRSGPVEWVLRGSVFSPLNYALGPCEIAS
jgi:hypothetical protein